MSQTVDRAAESSAPVSRATSAVADGIIEDSAEVVRHAAKQGSDAAKEILNDATRRTQRQPALTVALTFAVGFTAGALIGLIMKQS
jgi:hypothetical protein